MRLHAAKTKQEDASSGRLGSIPVRPHVRVRRTAVATARGSVVACAATLPCFFRLNWPNRLVVAVRPMVATREWGVFFRHHGGGDAGNRAIFCGYGGRGAANLSSQARPVVS